MDQLHDIGEGIGKIGFQKQVEWGDKKSGDSLFFYFGQCDKTHSTKAIKPIIQYLL